MPVLFQTWKPPFTACTKLFGPTAPLVSGGVPVTVALVVAFPWPLKLLSAAGIVEIGPSGWCTGSTPAFPYGANRGMRNTSCSSPSSPSCSAGSGKSRSGSELSAYAACTRSGPRRSTLRDVSAGPAKKFGARGVGAS